MPGWRDCGPTPDEYSRALLETLALIAYRQPITRGEIEQIRGVAVSTNIVKRWRNASGSASSATATARQAGAVRHDAQFLDYFNLKSLDELPPLSEIRDIEDFDPQLDARRRPPRDRRRRRIATTTPTTNGDSARRDTRECGRQSASRSTQTTDPPPPPPTPTDAAGAGDKTPGIRA